MTDPKWTKGDSFQADDLVSDASQQAPDLAVLAFSQLQFQKRAATFLLQRANTSKTEVALRKVHSLAKLGQSFRRGKSGNLHAIPPHNFVTRVSQAFGKVAIVCDQQQALSVLIQSADGKQPLILSRHQIHRARPSGRIVARTQNAFWLVQQEIAQARLPQAFPVDADVVVFRVDSRRRISDNATVDRDSTVANVGLAVATRIDSRRCQKLLKSYVAAVCHVGIRTVRGWISGISSGASRLRRRTATASLASRAGTRTLTGHGAGDSQKLSGGMRDVRETQDSTHCTARHRGDSSGKLKMPLDT